MLPARRHHSLHVRVGYAPQTVQITLRAGTMTQDFTLFESPLQLGEVIVTGAGTSQAREALGNVINTVDSTLILRAATPQNVVSALAATAPNVRIRTNLLAESRARRRGKEIPARFFYDASERQTDSSIPLPTQQPTRNANDPANAVSDATGAACLEQ